MRKLTLEQNIDEYISHKKLKLMSKNNNEQMDPIMQVFDLLNLQELDIKVRSVNQIEVKSRGRIKRGGKKTRRKKEKLERKAQSAPPNNRQDEAPPGEPDEKLQSLLLKFRSVSHKNISEGDQKESRQDRKKERQKAGKPSNSLYKKGARANWDLAHKRHVKGLSKAKDYINSSSCKQKNGRKGEY